MKPADVPPPKIMRTFARLWKMETPIVVSLLPRDAWVVLGMIQFASRNPLLTPEHYAALESFGRQIQNHLATIAPEAGTYLELGWDPAHDVPNDP